METEAGVVGVGESSLSVTSNVSTTGSSGPNAHHRSRVIPLYNLTFHSFLPSTVSDAGTDERVAKVNKKGQAELDGLMVLEPSELVWGLNDIDTVVRSRPASRTMPPTIAPHATTLHSTTLASHPTPLELVNEGPSTPGSTTSPDPFFSTAQSPSPLPKSPSISLNGVPATLAEAGQLTLLQQQQSSTTTRTSMLRPTSAHSVQSPPSTSSPAIPRSATAIAALGSATPPITTTKRNTLFGRNVLAIQPPNNNNEAGNKFLLGFKRFVTPRNISNPLNPSNPNIKKGDSFSSLTRTLSPTTSNLDSPSSTTNQADPRSRSRSSFNEPRLSTSTSKSFDLGGSRTSLRGTRPGDGVPMWPIESREGTHRAQGYVWTVRKWLRKPSDCSSLSGEAYPVNQTNHQILGVRPSTSLHSLRSGTSSGSTTFSKVWSRYNLVERAGGNEPAPSPVTVPIRIEWTRDSSRARRYRANERARASALAQLDQLVPSSTRGRPGLDPVARDLPVPTTDRSTTSPVRSTSQMGHPSTQDPGEIRAQDPTLGSLGQEKLHPASLTSQTKDPQSPSVPQTEHDTMENVDDDDNDDDADSANDSDPEDSEAPWRCALVLGPWTRVPLAVLTPAPHHPRLAGQLTVPFPLPDLRGSGLGPDRAGLSPEELKDLALVTALHLVVREGFGAMAKSKRT